ncbi:MAG: hypothetical protein JKY42_11425, partial [Flavobacteriales bacterium]|nr:hypothetical protein [Flavobacteriales bacterium]
MVLDNQIGSDEERQSNSIKKISEAVKNHAFKDRTSSNLDVVKAEKIEHNGLIEVGHKNVNAQTFTKIYNANKTAEADQWRLQDSQTYLLSASKAAIKVGAIADSKVLKSEAARIAPLVKIERYNERESQAKDSLGEENSISRGDSGERSDSGENKAAVVDIKKADVVVPIKPIKHQEENISNKGSFTEAKIDNK